MVKKIPLERKAERALRRRLQRERDVYGMVGIPTRFVVSKEPYDGAGDRFEIYVKFDRGGPHVYEVILYGGGKSSRIYEL